MYKIITMISPKDSAFLAELFANHSRELLNFMRDRSSAENDPEDVVQEAFLRLMQYTAQFDVRSPRSFLYRAIGNLLIDRHRHRAVQRANETTLRVTFADDHSPAAERDYAGQQTLQQFQACLQGLPRLCRHAFILHRVEGLSHLEVARRLGISVRTSERYVMQAMRVIVSELELELTDRKLDQT